MHKNRSRLLATVLFADIAGSTERAAALGYCPWRELLEALMPEGPRRAEAIPRT